MLFQVRNDFAIIYRFLEHVELLLLNNDGKESLVINHQNYPTTKDKVYRASCTPTNDQPVQTTFSRTNDVSRCVHAHDKCVKCQLLYYIFATEMVQNNHKKTITNNKRAEYKTSANRPRCPRRLQRQRYE